MARWERKERVGELVALTGPFAAVGLLANTVHDAQNVVSEWDTRHDASFALIRQPADPPRDGDDVWLYNSGWRPLFLCVSSPVTATSARGSSGDTIRRLSPGYCIRVFRGGDDSQQQTTLTVSVGKGWGPNYQRLFLTDTPCRYEVLFVS